MIFFFHDGFECIFFPAGNGFTDDEAKYFADALSVSYQLCPAFLVISIFINCSFATCTCHVAILLHSDQFQDKGTGSEP